MKYIKSNITVNRKKTILMLMPAFSFSQLGGAETQALKLIEQLIKKDFDIIILTERKIRNFEKNLSREITIRRVYSIFSILLHSLGDIVSILEKIKKHWPYKKTRSDSLFPSYSDLEKEFGYILRFRDIIVASVFF